VKRFSSHGEFCPTDCSTNTDAEDILECYSVSPEALDALAVGEKIEFEDNNGVRCNLQKSSAGTQEKIWLGCEDANPRVLIHNKGWQPIDMPLEYLADTRMHLTRRQVWALLPHLIRFVLTGRI